MARVWRELRRDRAGLGGLIVLCVFAIVALAAPLIADAASCGQSAGRNNPDLAAPSLEFPLGTDEIGRDVFAQVVWGARVSLYIGLLATVVAVVIGSVIGLVAGYARGWIGWVMLAIDDFFLVLPFIPLAIVLADASSAGRRPCWRWSSAVTSWAGSARLVRAQVLSLQRTRLRRTRPRPRWRWVGTSSPATCCPASRH